METTGRSWGITVSALESEGKTAGRSHRAGARTKESLGRSRHSKIDRITGGSVISAISFRLTALPLKSEIAVLGVAVPLAGEEHGRGPVESVSWAATPAPHRGFYIDQIPIEN
jgi:hypothetical protein